MTDRRHDLSGTWQGRYSYFGPREPVGFVAVVIDVVGSLGGTIHERCSEGEATGDHLYATLSGRHTGSAVTFVKTYDGTGGWKHSVDYEGTINEDGTEITGHWQVRDEWGVWTGPFLMIRANGKEDAVIGKAVQPADASLPLGHQDIGAARTVDVG
jgi:hypothetical protein